MPGRRARHTDRTSIMPNRAETKRSVREGIASGVAAGIVFLLAEMIAAVLVGRPPTMPLRMFASVGIGPHALTFAPLASTLIIGLLIHLGFSALFGMLYGVLNAHFAPRTRIDWLAQTAFGTLFGFLLWSFNFQVVARVLYPWLLELPQGLHASLHAFAYGLPLGLMMASAQRRAYHVVGPRPA
jgi:uncharacterized membrane protein YagU involved in acid resistance